MFYVDHHIESHINCQWKPFLLPSFYEEDCNNRKVRKNVQGHMGMTEPIFSHAIRIQSQVSLSLPCELLIPCELIIENIVKEHEIDFGRMSESR